MIAIDNEPRWTIDLRIATNFLPFTGDIPAGVVSFGTNTKIVATSIESFAELMVMNEIQLLSACERGDLSTVRQCHELLAYYYRLFQEIFHHPPQWRYPHDLVSFVTVLWLPLLTNWSFS